MVIALVQMHWQFDVVRVLTFLVTFVCGTAIAYSFMLLLTSISVWMVRNQSLMEMWWLFSSVARYPKEIFAGRWAEPLGTFFTYFLPILVVVNVPANAMVRVLDPPMVALIMAAAVILLWLSRRFFQLCPAVVSKREQLTQIDTRSPVARSDPEALRHRARSRSSSNCSGAITRCLREANAELNLTRIHNFENMVLKHYVDSLLVLEFVELPAPLIDMGSGPGLPGIPLKIARPEVPMILAEPRGARADFLREVCEQLGLKGVEVYAHKVGPDYPGQVGGVITRAVGSIPETLDRVASCLGPGGRMIFMKGPECDQEIGRGARSRTRVVFRLAADHAYAIPGTTHHRRLRRVRATGRRGRPSQSDEHRARSRRRGRVRRRGPGDHQCLESDVSALPRPA